MKSKKIKRISLRNTVLNFFNLAALGFILVIGLTFLFQIILPLINNVQKGQAIYKNLNDFLQQIQDKNELQKLFVIGKIDPSNVALIASIQATFLNMEQELEKAFTLLNDPNNVDYLGTFNSSIDIVLKAIETFDNVSEEISLAPSALEQIKNFEIAKNIINDVNKIGTE